MAKNSIYVAIVISYIFWVGCQPSAADWINLSGAENAPNIAEIHINDDHVRITLEIFVQDLVVFDRLIPDDFFQGSNIQRPTLQERVRQFAEEDFQVIADGTRKLPARLLVAEPRFRKERPSPYANKINPYTLQRIPGPPEDKRVLYVEIIYPFQNRPASLTFVPPIDDVGVGKVSMGFITYHNQVPINDFRYLSEPSTVTLDWQDPWYSQFDNKGLKRWQRGGVMSFVYIEPYEVRHEILARVKDLEAWIDLDLKGDEYIEADENELLKKRVGDFFLKRDNVLIDGNPLSPILDRTSFVKYTLTRTYFLDIPERIHKNTAMIGVIITYLTNGVPQTVTNTWDLWSDRIQKIPADAIDPAGPFPSYLTPDSNVMTWKNFLKKYTPPTVARIELDRSMTTMNLPLASFVCLGALVPLGIQIRKRYRSGQPISIHTGIVILFIGGSLLLFPLWNLPVAKPATLAPRMSSEEAVEVLGSLLKNIYRSFDFRGEEAVYDRLATSVSGDLLSDIYLQNRRSLVVTQAGGAQARVKEVNLLSVNVEPSNTNSLGVKFDAQWTAMGSVGHWGHIHNRKNQYHALITVEPVDGAWKIVGLELLDEKRIDPYLQ